MCILLRGARAAARPCIAAASAAAAQVPDPAFYAFPTLEQLSKATGADLRADGFGYRSRHVSASDPGLGAFRSPKVQVARYCNPCKGRQIKQTKQVVDRL
ncbi:hypothetical protein WJX72_004959 [[Myrmecia] bisecta]|uniref:Uncharacterized protein n=1 Tax=[Myrmecia] bisecta TaxID=41462 RepID=A0AAW1PQ13_9CHLO